MRKRKASRRPRGEGTIYQTKLGRWMYSIRLGNDADGNLIRRSWSFDTKPQAEAKQHEVLGTLRRGSTLSDSKSLTLNAYLNQWLETRKGNIADSTYELYESLIRVHITPSIGSRKLESLNTLDLQLFLNNQLRTEAQPLNLSASSVKRLRDMLGAAFKAAAAWNLIAINPMPKTLTPKVPHTDIHPLTLEQTRLFLTQLHGERLEALYKLAVGLGMRQGELLGLRWGDVDLINGILYVKHSLKHRKPKNAKTIFYIGSTKTSKSRRVLHLPADLKDALKSHKELQDKERLEWGNEWRDNELVFCTSVGSNLEPSNLRRHFRLILTKAKLPNVRFHDLRHTAATLMLSAGIALKVVSDILGHENIATTANIYQHVLPSTMREALTIMDEMINKDLTSSEDVV